MEKKIEIILPCDQIYLPICQNAAIEMASMKGFNVEELDDISISICEAIKYVLCHNSKCWCAKYKVSIEDCEKWIEIQVSREGNKFIPKTSKRCLDCPKEGELSINVVKSLMDGIEISKENDEIQSIKMVKRYVE